MPDRQDVWRRFFGDVTVEVAMRGEPVPRGGEVELAIRLLDEACFRSGQHFNDTHVEAVAALLRAALGSPEAPASEQRAA